GFGIPQCAHPSPGDRWRTRRCPLLLHDRQRGIEDIRADGVPELLVDAGDPLAEGTGVLDLVDLHAGFLELLEDPRVDLRHLLTLPGNAVLRRGADVLLRL